ncbi:MAG: hypothetical protein RMJ98_16105 [Myxococcales bacterium]|nr:hypothetical protein [Myxococcales bacterium]
MSGTDGGSAGGEGGSPALDLDGDSWTQEDGDCCETQEQCPSPEIVNPGAFEIGGNDLDDNCDGVTDQGDALASCDVGRPSAVTNGLTAARALGLCAQASPENRRWGLLEARLLRADGSPLQDLRALSLRPSFGGLVPTPLEGERLLVLSTGIASDGSQKDPGPNGGAPLGSNVSGVHEPSSTVSLTQPGATDSVADWFAAAMPPLKPASSLPLVVGCPGQSSEHAADSVMLALRIRVPTNARSFSFRTRFLSAEYPEFVCTSYSDQYVALLGGPGAIGAPPDGNLLLYTDENGMPWPLSLPLALTPHFTVCEPEAEKPACWKSKVHPGACSEGAAMLTGTGFETPSGKPCPIGGATGWFVVRGAVIPGKEISLRLALWDVGDALFDSVALLDDFRWSTQEVPVGATPE